MLCCHIEQRLSQSCVSRSSEFCWWNLSSSVRRLLPEVTVVFLLLFITENKHCWWTQGASLKICDWDARTSSMFPRKSIWTEQVSMWIFQGFVFVFLNLFVLNYVAHTQMYHLPTKAKTVSIKILRCILLIYNVSSSSSNSYLCCNKYECQVKMCVHLADHVKHWLDSWDLVWKNLKRRDLVVSHFIGFNIATD